MKLIKMTIYIDIITVSIYIVQEYAQAYSTHMATQGYKNKYSCCIWTLTNSIF